LVGDAARIEAGVREFGDVEVVHDPVLAGQAAMASDAPEAGDSGVGAGDTWNGDGGDAGIAPARDR
ncbi:MAG: hypothetical protein M0Z49_14050, partial [Chloroflexi bacterium]|nr:hypothetical protein [Chloroflexota bacterium]